MGCLDVSECEGLVHDDDDDDDDDDYDDDGGGGGGLETPNRWVALMSLSKL